MIVLSYDLAGSERQEERFADAERAEAERRRSELESIALLPNSEVSNIAWGLQPQEAPPVAPQENAGVTISIHVEVTQTTVEEASGEL